MKGKVLGFDPATGSGAITGDDGNRYSFTTADNKGGVPLKPNDTVDFEVEGNAARNIYAVKTGFAIPSLGAGAPGAGGETAAGGDLVKQIMAKPNVIWAAVIILGSLVAGYLNALGFLNQMSGPFGTGLGISALIAALLFFVPFVAGALIFFELTNHKLTAQWRMITAAVAIGAPILLPILAGLLAPQSYKEAMSMAAAFGAGSVGGGFFGFAITPGMLITVAGGVLIVLTQMGIVKLPKG